MGMWITEVLKMAMYISFPVGVYHWFNQPENFENWVVKTKRMIYPQMSSSQFKDFHDFAYEYNYQKDMQEVEEMEKKYKKTAM